jgi:HK97 family phage portal protein
MLNWLRGTLQRRSAPSVSTFGWWPISSAAAPDLTEQGALRIAAAYRAVQLISGDIARLGARVEGGAGDLLEGDASRYHTQFEFRRAMMVNVLLYGNAFAYVARDTRGQAVELQLLLPEEITLDTTGGTVRYRHSRMGLLEPEEVFHVKALGSDGIWGKSPIRTARDSFSLGQNLARTGNAVFGNAGVPKIALVHPGPLSPEAQQRIANSYMERHAGADNAGRPIVLAEGMKVETIGGTLEDSVYVQASNFTVQEIARIFGVPNAYLNDTSSSSFSGLEALMRIYVEGCLAHWAEQWAQEYRRKVMGGVGRVVWDFDVLLRPTLAETMAALRTGVEASIITRNEARSRLDLDPVPDGDEFILAKNMGTGGGTTNAGDDTSQTAGSVNDFTA